MSPLGPTKRPGGVRELERQLQAAEDALRAVLSGEADALQLDPDSGPILLRDAAEALVASEQLFRAMFDLSLDATMITDDNGHFIDVNPASCELFGLPREHLLEANIHRSCAPEVDFGGLWAQLLMNGTGRGEFELVRSDGDRRSVEYAAVANFVPGRHLLVLRDLTRRRRMEEQTAALREQLHHAQKMEAIGRLAAGVAHDFNNLLVAIVGYSQLLTVNLEPGSEMCDYAEQISKAGEQAAVLVRDLLAFGRRQMLRIETVDLNELIVDAERLLHRVLPENVELELALAPDLHPVEADRTQLQQVIMNLAVNARDAMPTGGRLRIATENIGFDGSVALLPSPPTGDYVCMSVRDTGVGMDEETRARAFEPFFTTKSRGAGTGLGLATVYGTVQQIGGLVTIHSELGRGSTFDVYLPRSVNAVPDRPSPREQQRAPVARARVLVVEDNDLVRDLVERVLKAAGHEVVVARSAAEALQRVRNAPFAFDLLLTDVVMPETSGVDLFRTVRQHQPQLRVLFMSGHTDEAVAAHGVLDPASTLITKPFSPARLHERVEQILRR